jgi:outer membrane lipoprotein carrier protein
MRIRRIIVSATLALIATAPAPAAETTAREELKRFFATTQTYSARFQQRVLDASLNAVEESSGTMALKRPGMFRWDYDPPARQRIISDGKKVWIYDPDLRQITARRVDAALGRTPAMMLAGSGDLEVHFTVREIGAQGAQLWVGLKPRDEDGSFSDLRIGFENGALKVMELVDLLGQTTRITLIEGRANAEIPSERFAFVVPEGVDLIDESQ